MEAAQAIGVRNSVGTVLGRILPNTISAILVQATVDLGTVILAMGGLAFLGTQHRPPPRLGFNGFGRTHLHFGAMVDFNLPWIGYFSRRPGIQPDRRHTPRYF